MNRLVWDVAAALFVIACFTAGFSMLFWAVLVSYGFEAMTAFGLALILTAVVFLT